MPEKNHAVAALHGLILARLGRTADARAAFTDALHHADTMLAQTPNLYEVLYARALAHAGLALVAGTDTAPAITDYQAARSIGDEKPGIVNRELKLLDALMHCPGGHILAPVRAALSGG